MIPNNIVYDMTAITECGIDTVDCYICAFHNDERSSEGLRKLLHQGIQIKKVIAILYTGCCSKDRIPSEIDKENIIEVTVDKSPNGVIYGFKDVIKEFVNNKIAIDISCIRTPDLFSILKMLKLLNHTNELLCLYSVPYDYEYSSGDFLYKDSLGDLDNYDLFGFGGNYNSSDPSATYVVFLGFEGALSLKILEEAEYKILNFVNGLPSLYQKYKDISVVNNSSAIKGKAYHAMLYTPADNPFETYNLLERKFMDCRSLCIAPLGTKPTALGICLYALEHENVRVVYPISESYSPHLTNRVIKTWVYGISI